MLFCHWQYLPQGFLHPVMKNLNLQQMKALIFLHTNQRHVA